MSEPTDNPVGPPEPAAPSAFAGAGADKVEEVARAINSEFMSFGNDPMPRDTALGVAWAAIAAMREPTKPMVQEAWRCTLGNLRPEEAYRHMIDAALSPSSAAPQNNQEPKSE